MYRYLTDSSTNAREWHFSPQLRSVFVIAAATSPQQFDWLERLVETLLTHSLSIAKDHQIRCRRKTKKLTKICGLYWPITAYDIQPSSSRRLATLWTLTSCTLSYPLFSAKIPIPIRSIHCSQQCSGTYQSRRSGRTFSLKIKNLKKSEF